MNVSKQNFIGISDYQQTNVYIYFVLWHTKWKHLLKWIIK